MSPSRPGCVMHKSQVISWQRDSRHRCPAWLNLSTTIGPSQAARSPALSHGRDRWNGVSSWFTAPTESPAAWRPRSASAAWFTAALGQPARAGGMPLPESSPRLKCWPHLHLLGERISTRGVLTANVSSGGSQVLGGGQSPARLACLPSPWECILVSVRGCTCCPRNRAGAAPESSSLKAQVSSICPAPARPGQAKGVGTGDRAKYTGRPPCPGRSGFFGEEGGGGWEQDNPGSRKETREGTALGSVINHAGYSCPGSVRLQGGDPSNGDLLYLILLLSLIAFNQWQARTSFE